MLAEVTPLQTFKNYYFENGVSTFGADNLKSLCSKTKSSKALQELFLSNVLILLTRVVEKNLFYYSEGASWVKTILMVHLRKHKRRDHN